MKPNFLRIHTIIISVILLFTATPVLSYVPDDLDFAPMGAGAALVQKGRLYVDTDPSDARIRILNIGPMYRRGMELKAGRYHVEVSASSCETKRQWVDLAAGEDKYIDIRLAERQTAVTPPPTDRTFTNTIGMKFVLIPKGTFMMGSPSNESGRDSDEKQHKVTLTKGFYMGTTEVTQAQWKAIMGDDPSYFKGDDNPVEIVSWNDAQEFIKKLNRKDGTNKYRLPTEAEWEYACRAGSKTKFCFGDSDSRLGDYAWYSNNSSSKTHSVAQKKPNAWGLYDMHGNVYEWCGDWYDKNYPGGYVTDPKGPSSGSYRVYRGGSWGSGRAGGCRSANRDDFTPGRRDDYRGLRLARAR